MSPTEGRVPQLDAFRRAYSTFLRPPRVLLSGHSHQAWPNCAAAAMQRFFEDSAVHVDEKWGAVIFPMMEEVAAKILTRLGLPTGGGGLAFGKSTHELCYRLLSAFPATPATHVVTTTGEFHSLHRQLCRLAQEGARVTFVEANPKNTLAQRLMDALVPGVTLLAASTVFFEDAFILPHLGALTQKARSLGAQVLWDAYHAFNVVPMVWGEAATQACVTAGGYKYAQFGEGLCWLRVPAHAQLRPAYTGWFADFAALALPRSQQVSYSAGANAFLGATFDPCALYRAQAVLQHWDAFGLTVDALRAVSLRHTQHILDGLQARGVSERFPWVSPAAKDRRGGFVSLRVARAGEAVVALRALGIHTDSRGDLLRLGPAPYLDDAELEGALDGVKSVLHAG